MSSATVPAPMIIRGRVFDWGARTYVMGILNITPDSFSGDGLAHQGTESAVLVAAVRQAAVRQAAHMVATGADLLDVGGQSTRPNHQPVTSDEELRRVVPVIRALRTVMPRVPISVDTRKRDVAAAALDAGADVLNDVGGVTGDGSLARLAGERGVAYVLMHDRILGAGSTISSEPSAVKMVLADLAVAIERAVALGCPRTSIILDPGVGFGKTPAQNLELIRDLVQLRVLGRPVLLGASRKSTIGRVLDLPAPDRLEGTLATTALGVAGWVDVVRVHDVQANSRVARMSDAIVRGWQPTDQET